ncbi:uncharacterized protein LOC128231170 isoform X2 [Mya arenaria]|uniref:uncharacterized protein LOC128231170 isoform X1 n=1 Tax=Mya arenaria TaxID=6604 RepID=UPI0022E5F214|nr:uncharacterized protein LOC128231170 isoform X1 [Mya arenaria]XP_052799612.1 uncharacterized protein LOC128231170 isoform X2 [Mya arenaria]
MVLVYDFIRSTALVLCIGYTSQQNRKTWMWGDSILWSAYCAGLFAFPGMLLPENDSAFLAYAVRVFASLLLGIAAMSYLSRSTRDENVIGTTLWARLLGSMFVMVMFTYFYFQTPDKFSEKTLYFDFEAFGLLFLSSVYQFWRAGYRIGGREQKGNVSTVLRILFLICFTSGILNLTFPNWVIPLKKLDVLEGMMVRCCGVLLLSWAFISLYATSFRYDDDRSNFFVSAMISCGLMLASLNIAYFWDGVFDSQQALFMHIGCIPTFVVLVGLLLLWRQSPGTQTNYNLRSKSE